MSARLHAKDVVTPQHDGALPIMIGCDRRLALAWSCASVLLFVATFAYFLLSFTLDTATSEATLFEAELRANAITRGEWCASDPAAFPSKESHPLAIAKNTPSGVARK